MQAALASRDAYEASLKAAGRAQITTEIAPAPVFYFAEEDHQQYLAKNPAGLLQPARHGRRLRHPAGGRFRLTGCRRGSTNGAAARSPDRFPNGQDSA